MLSRSAEFPLSKSENLVVQSFEDELLVYDLKFNRAFSLNKTLKLVWELCDGKTSVPEIARKLELQLNKPVGEKLVWLAVDQLKKEDLLENADDLQIDFAGLSRREVIKKVGLASAAALPVICSIVAPSAANAQSSALRANGAVCTTSSDCASNKCQGVCCSPTSNPGAQAPGYYFGAASCRTTDAACQSDWSAACCSGKASLSTINGLCFFDGEFQCECDPY